MPQATFTPKFINPPKGNARSASVKDSDGGYWGIHPGDQNKFQVGVPVTVEYATSENNGRTYYNVRSIVGQQAPSNPQARVVQLEQPQRNVQQRQSQPNPQAVDEAKKSENIFVTTVVQAAIQYQSYPLDVDSLTRLVQFARSAWRPELRIDEPPFPGDPPPPASEEDYYNG